MWTAALAKKYYQVLQRYYVQYLSGYDADLLNQRIQVCSVCILHICVHLLCHNLFHLLLR